MESAQYFENEIRSAKTISQDTLARIQMINNFLKPMQWRLKDMEVELEEQIKQNNKIAPLSKTARKKLKKDEADLLDDMQGVV